MYMYICIQTLYMHTYCTGKLWRGAFLMTQSLLVEHSRTGVVVDVLDLPQRLKA